MIRIRLLILFALLLPACSQTTPSSEPEPIRESVATPEEQVSVEASYAAYQNYYLYLVRPDGSELRQLTSVGHEDFAGAWSPDGTRLLFASYRHDNTDLYTIAADGGDLRRLTDDPAMDSSPLWSPDGQRIAWVRTQTGAAYRRDVMVMNADGSDVRQLTPAYTENSQPAWSPDGTRLAWSAFTGEGTDIFVANWDGSDLRQLTDDVGYDEYPVWSPDGTQLYFWSDRAGNGDLFAMNADGSEPRHLTNDPAIEGGFALSPDGRQIAFTSNRGASHPDIQNVFVMNVEGRELLQLTTDPFGGSSPVWSPDGRQIAFTSFREQSGRLTFVVDAAGGEALPLSDASEMDDIAPLWSPTGEWIVFSRGEPTTFPEGAPVDDILVELRDETAIYSAVIRQIYDHDDTFGGQRHPSTLYIMSQTDDRAGDPTLANSAGRPISEAVQRAIEDNLVDLPVTIVWVDQRDDAPQDATGTVADGAVITLGNIHHQEAQRLHVAGAIYVAPDGAGGRTYLIEKVEGVWTISGTTGPAWIS